MQQDANDLHQRIRAALLAAKVLAVGAYFGSLSTVTALWYRAAPALSGARPITRLHLLELLSWLIRFLMVPSLLLASITGVLLVMQSPSRFVRMRWWRLKVSAIVVGVPAAHFYMSSRLELARDAAQAGLSDPTLHRQFGVGLWVILAVTVAVVLLGRFKPNIGRR